MFSQLIVCVLVFASVCAKPNLSITFQNVTVRGLSLFTYKFNVTIISSNSLKEHLPKTLYDAIEIIDSDIPILYEDSISDLESLDELILIKDQIKDIQPGAFKNVPQLRKLKINDNDIKIIREGVFNHLSISTIELRNNNIKSIVSGAFDNMPQLLNIDLSDNKIDAWKPSWFQNTPLLTRVSFQNNRISQIPEKAFINFAGEKHFGKLSLKINIILSKNKIHTIANNAFEGLKEINNLWLDYNKITNLPENVFKDLKIDDLRLNYNTISCIKSNFEYIFVANVNHIDGNPMDCECIKAIHEWAKKNGKNIQSFYSTLSCEADRIKKKIDDLNKRLKKIQFKSSDEIEDLA